MKRAKRRKKERRKRLVLLATLMVVLAGVLLRVTFHSAGARETVNWVQAEGTLQKSGEKQESSDFPASTTSFPQVSLSVASISPPAVAAEAAVLIDLTTGQELFAKNADQPMYPASTTKILTAVLAIEHGRLDDLVVIPPEATLVEGSAIGLQAGERVRLRDLLYALMLESGNDAAVAIACHIAGSVPAFAAMMNETARQWGARNSHFVNPSGLPDPEHYVTARDLALIARRAMNNDIFSSIVREKLKVIERPEAASDKGPPQVHMYNHNKLLWRYPGADGVKTGYTVEAGHCLVASASREGRRLLTVVLKSNAVDVYRDSTVLLDYGFQAFTPYQLVDVKDDLGRVALRYGSSQLQLASGGRLLYNFPVGEKVEIRRQLNLAPVLKAPVRAGEQVGEAIYYWKNIEIGRVPVLAANSVDRRWYLKPQWWVVTALVGGGGLWLGLRLMRRRYCSSRRYY